MEWLASLIFVKEFNLNIYVTLSSMISGCLFEVILKVAFDIRCVNTKNNLAVLFESMPFIS